MKASEFAGILHAAIEKHGDLDLFVFDQNGNYVKAEVVDLFRIFGSHHYGLFIGDLEDEL